MIRHPGNGYERGWTLRIFELALRRDNLNVSQQGLKPFTKVVNLADRKTKIEDVRLNLETVTQEVEVTERAESLSIENSAAETTVSSLKIYR